MSYEYLKDYKYAFSFATLIVKKPIISITCFFITAIILAIGAQHTKEEYSARAWFDKNHPNIEELDQFEKTFGSDETIIIGINHPNGLYDKKVLTAISDITEKLWLVKDIIRVERGNRE